MITFDLECSNGHIFEGWFDSLSSFEDQENKKLVRCPTCDDFHVRRVLSPVAVRKSSPERQTAPPSVAPIDYRRLAREMVDYMQKNSKDVGAGFTAEALKMHYGVSEKKNIRGTATAEEEKTLKEEGVEFFKVPWPKWEDKKKKN